jgi:hypothetical protein
MPRTRSTDRTQILDWLQSGGLLVVTILGLLLYIFLAVPATVFYAHLGTSPGEAGINYVSLLSGSTVELLAILVILTAAFLAVAFLIAFIGIWIRFIIAIPYLRRQGRSYFSESLQDLTDSQFEERISFIKGRHERFPESLELANMLNPGLPKSIPAIEANFRRMRKLLTLQTRTPEEAIELHILESQDEILSIPPLTFPGPLTKFWIRRRGRLLAVAFVLITVVIFLPALAFVQAGQVLDGKTYFGHNIGAFGYRADPVQVRPTSSHPPPSIQVLTTKKLFLLGQNAQYVILYSSSYHSTVRIPVSEVMIAGIQ